jgi:hypothetical protein
MRIFRRGARFYNNVSQMPYLQREIEKPCCPNGPRLVLRRQSTLRPHQKTTKSQSMEMDEYSKILMATNDIWASHLGQLSWTVFVNSAVQ